MARIIDLVLKVVIAEKDEQIAFVKPVFFIAKNTMHFRQIHSLVHHKMRWGQTISLCNDRGGGMDCCNIISRDPWVMASKEMMEAVGK